MDVLQPGYEMYTLREGNVLNMMGLGMCDIENTCYINKRQKENQQIFEVRR